MKNKRIFVKDKGKEFMSRMIIKLTQKFGIVHARTPRYQPQANPTERFNRSIKTAIKAFLQQQKTTKSGRKI